MRDVQSADKFSVSKKSVPYYVFHNAALRVTSQMKYTTFSECCDEVRARTELVFDARAPARLREMCALYQGHITSLETKRRQEPAFK